MCESRVVSLSPRLTTIYTCTIIVFFFNDTATTEIYTLSLHDALPIYQVGAGAGGALRDLLAEDGGERGQRHRGHEGRDRKSTRLNSSHDQISYAVFCLKKKKTRNYAP